jgi:hypothetical protein
MTEYTIIRQGHACPVPYDPEHGTIIRCEQCGQRWKYSHPGNPDYAGWATIPWWTRITRPSKRITTA